MNCQEMLIGESHELLTCPYNSSHQIESYRMATHLEKCRKSYPNVKKAKCPFDSTHEVNECELHYHIKHCSKKEIFDRLKYAVDDGVKFEPLAETPQLNNIAAENWDEEVTNSFNPAEVKKPPTVIRKVQGMKPAERRAFRMQQRQNYNKKAE